MATPFDDGVSLTKEERKCLDMALKIEELEKEVSKQTLKIGALEQEIGELRKCKQFALSNYNNLKKLYTEQVNRLFTILSEALTNMARTLDVVNKPDKRIIIRHIHSYKACLERNKNSWIENAPILF